MPEKLLLTASNRTSGGVLGSLADPDARALRARSAGPVLVSALRLVMADKLQHEPEKSLSARRRLQNHRRRPGGSQKITAASMCG
jgi:hypothetical protein